MPGGDQTGPSGRGPMTGRAAGYCAGHSEPGFVKPSPGYGRGLGRGWGRGRGFWWRGTAPEPYYITAPSTAEVKTYLENMVKDLEEEIKAIKERIQGLSEEKKIHPK